jgi:hypothetical protein
MKLKKREKILVWVTGGLVAIGGIWFLLMAGDPRTDEQLASEQTKLESEKENKKKIVDAFDREKKRLDDWKHRALPPDAVLARSLYQNWLSHLIEKTHLRNSTIVANDSGMHREQFTRISLDLRARAKLGDLVQFLYEFYTAGYLHQIRKLDVKPAQGSTDLEVIATIEALSLPTAVSKDKLPSEPRKELKAPKADPRLADYREPIVNRDFFAKYVPPPPPKRKDDENTVIIPAKIDPADFAFITGVVEVDGTPRIWLHDRLNDRLLQLAAGEGFSIGTAMGIVEAVDPQGAAILNYKDHKFKDGTHRLLHSGDSLHDGSEVRGEVPAQVPKTANSNQTLSLQHD